MPINLIDFVPNLSFPQRWESRVYRVFMDAFLLRYDRVIPYKIEEV